jgi:enamine deaminase RidA (YjgF/YER057c/UK114 family)
MKHNISSDKVAQSSSPLSQGIRFKDFIFLSGQLGRNPTTGKLEEDFVSQVRRILSNLRDLLETSGSSMDMVSIRIVRVLSSDLAGGHLLPMRHYTKATSAPTYYLRYQGTSGLIYALQH